MKRLVLLASLLPIAATSSDPAFAQTLTRGPYLQLGTSSSVIIVWRTLVAANGRVRYGTSPTSLTNVVDDPASATQHEVRVTGLAPSTKYYYSVGTSATVLAGGDSNHYFVTAPGVGTRTRFRAWILGDSGSGDLNQLAVRDSMGRFVGSNKPDILLHMGDIAYSSGTDLEFQFRHFAVYQDTLRNTVTWPTMGNHEGVSSNSATESGPYYDAFALPRRAEAGGLASGTEAYYSFDYANVHFVVLDSHETSRSPTGAMLRWMRDDLAATDQDWIIAFWHHPPYTKGSHDSDAETQLIEMRENALPILEAAGVDLVLAGHSHIYERSYLVNGAYDTPTTSAGRIIDSRSGQNDGGGPYIKNFGQNANEGAVYVVAGHGGASLGRNGTHPLMYFTERRFGSCLMTVDGLEVSIVNVRSDGVVTDHFAMRKRERDGGIGGVDAGLADAGLMDAGVADAGVRDGGAPDAGARDAGVTDAGSSDAGTRDAGVLDAGTIVDAGVVNEDGGTDPADAGNPDVDAGTAARSSGGCGCSSIGDSDLSVALALAALWLLRKRTMRRRREKKA